MNAPESASFRNFEYSGWSNEYICEKYDQHFGAVTGQSIDALLNAAKVMTGTRVLDVCTGAGYAAGLAAERGAQATGVDFSAAQVKLARAKYPVAAFEEADGTALPFGADTFDSVVSSMGIPHFADPDAAIREAFRVLKRGGVFAFTVYDMPERAVGVGAIYRAVQAHGTVNAALPQGPSFFLFSDSAEAARRLSAVGFVSISSAIHSQIWRLASVDEAIEAVLQGSVRAGATLRAQPAQAQLRIREAIVEMLNPYKQGTVYDVPMPIVLTTGTKP